MPSLLLKVYAATIALVTRQEGQDLVEYSLVIALLAFASVAGMHSLASGISVALDNASTGLANAV
jgi:pilus assembly protein Flp/PilA